MKKLILSLAAACAALSLSAAQEVIFKSEFEKNKDLKGWFDISNNSTRNGIGSKTPLKPVTMASVVEDNGEIFMKCKKSIFGMTHPFPKAITVDDNLKSITMKLSVRSFPKNNATLCSFAMTSRIHPGSASPFQSKGHDSGVAVVGYMHNVPGANYIYSMKNGVATKKQRSTKPFALFPSTFLRKWVNCALTYDNVAKTLTFTCDGMQPLVYQKVDMKGTVLRSLYICTNNYSFKNIEVSCVRK